MINFRKYNMYAWLGVATPTVVVVNAVARVLPEKLRRAVALAMARF